VVLESNFVGMVVVPCIVHMVHKVVSMVDKDCHKGRKSR